MDQRDDFVRTSLRIPRAVYDRLGEAAGRKRSLNAEIIQRLEHTFELDQIISDAEALPESPLETEMREHRALLRRLEERVVEAAKPAPEAPDVLHAPVNNILYIMLDANGLPVGWEELMLHLGEIVRSAGGTFDRVDAMMLNSTIPKGMDPAARLALVRKRYKEKRFSMGQMGDAKPDAPRIRNRTKTPKPE